MARPPGHSLSNDPSICTTNRERRPSLLGCNVMVVTDDPGNFPRAVFVSPQLNELPFPNWFCVIMPRVVEAMNTHLYRTIALHVIHLYCPRQEFPGHFAADILPYASDQIFFTQCYSTLIVIKLHIVGDE